MRGANYRVVLQSSVTKVTVGFMVALLFLLSFPLIVHAEDVQNQETPVLVAAPETLSATSPTYAYDITWEWALPVGGLTPEATPEDPGEHSSDIVGFGYELFKNGVSTGPAVSVAVDPLTLTTTVDEDAAYTLRLWSIDRAGNISEPIEASIDIVKFIAGDPVLPPIDESIIPKPVDTVPVAAPLVSSTAPINNRTYYVGGSTGQVVAPDASVLSAQTSDVPLPFGTTAAVKQSSQGWMIMGLAWYFWLLILAGIFTAGRGIVAFINHR